MFESALNRLLALQNAVEKSMDNDYFGQLSPDRNCQPAINIFENGDQIILTAELPGVKKEDINLEIKQNQLRISGKRKINYDQELSVHRLERKNYQFDRAVKLPFETEPEQVEAKFENGVLSVLLSESEQSKPKKISIL